METTVRHQERLQYAEVYISDVLELKEIFLRTQHTAMINDHFGIPFLLSKKKKRILSFASLTLGENKIGFKIFHTPEATESERKAFGDKAGDYFKKNTTANFRDPEQLKSSIIRMIEWLNF